MPQDICGEEDDDGAQHAVREAGDQRVLPGEVDDVDSPTPGEHPRRTDDQEPAYTALEPRRGDAGRIFPGLWRRWSKKMPDRAPSDGDGKRQGDDDQNEPKARHGSQHPEHPQQHDADRQQCVACTAAQMMRLG